MVYSMRLQGSCIVRFRLRRRIHTLEMKTARISASRIITWWVGWVHIPTYLLLHHLRINLRRPEILMPQHRTDRLNRNPIRERHRRGESVPCCMKRKLFQICIDPLVGDYR